MKHIFTLTALVFATSCFGQEACPNVHDINSNGTIDIEDFLSILGLFADVDVDGDGVWDSQDDCLDATACNYLVSPTEPCGYLDALGECGGACEGDGDGDGICDDVDTCVGEIDECGVCNGPGPTEVVVENITILYDSVYAEQIDEWWVFEVGADTTFSITCTPFFGECGDPVSYQGYDYATVLIGEQCWFAENLRSENYENGDAILANLSDDEWTENAVSLELGAVTLYGEGLTSCYEGSPDGDACDEFWSLGEYGRLYNWFAVDDTRGLCPSGWHVPTDSEWSALVQELGGVSEAAQEMKSTYGWHAEGNGTNSSGFSGLPGGSRGAGGGFELAGYQGFWWSSTASSSPGYAQFRYLYYVSPWNISPVGHGQEKAYSVRCIKDSE